MSFKKKTLFFIVPFTLFVFMAVLHPGLEAREDYWEPSVSDSPEVDTPETIEGTDYDDYLEDKEHHFPDETVSIDVTDTYVSHVEGDYEAEVVSHEGREGLYTPEEGVVEWDFELPEKGLYNIEVTYYPTEGNSSPIERAILVNDEVPFNEMGAVTFYRIWEDTFNVSDERIEDMNDIKPSQVEAPFWKTEYVRDMRGRHISPFSVEFQEGDNTIAFQAIREPMVIEEIVITQAEETAEYETAIDRYEAEGYRPVDMDDAITVQAEKTAYKSAPTLYPISDRTSMRTEPYHPSLVRLNVIGGYNWRDPGDFIAWEIDVPEKGLYKLNVKALQNFSRGSFSTRSLYVNDKIPFKEAENIEFNYESGWQNKTLGDDGESYYIPLEEGKNEIRLAATVGRYGEMIENVQEVIQNLNDLYREIIMFTSVQPDPYRDYQLEERISDLDEQLAENRDVLNQTIDQVIEITGERGAEVAVLDRTAMQLDAFHENPREIQSRVNELRENISSLGTWVLTTIEQPLTIDSIQVHDDDYDPPRASANVFERILHEIRIFFSSFFIDYSVLRESDVDQDKEIEVWLSADLMASAQQQPGAMSAGRDQANVLRQLIDETFTPNSNISVEMKVVNHNVLLPATLAGNGPDVALSVDQEQPVNFAMRNALHDLTEFDDFEEVKDRFYSGAMTPYEYNDGYYALPEQFAFLVMFYRTDILEDLDLEPPNTWEEMIELIPQLQRYNLDFYLPQTPTKINPLYYAMLKQKSGNLYTEDDRNIALLDDAGADSFETFSNFYADYSFTVTANFPNRFRSGEMPIGISYYSDYNTLSVFAPEIRGQWDFMELPGTLNEAGTIDRSSAANSNASVILDDSQNKEESWEFMKWWSSTDTQVRFGREMEGILGAAARYPTANKEALAQLPWPTKDYQVLDEQAESAEGIPVVPGSYISGRYIDNAYRAVINDGANPREALFDYSRRIDAEIARKRIEFGLD